MRESIQLHEIRCERCVTRLATELGPVAGINDARVEMGTSSIVVDYEDEAKEDLEAAIKRAGFSIIERTPRPREV